MKIGIDLGGSHIAIGVVDKNGEIIEKSEKRLTTFEKKNIKQSIEECIIKYVSFFAEKYNITQIGMAIPGWAENGVILSSGNLEIKNYAIVEQLQKQIKLPITIRNDAKCAALAENIYGCLKGYTRSLFLTLGTGIGGAAFINNELLKGDRRPGYEFGHIVIDKNGIPCICGRKGCFERYASMKAFKDNLRNALHLSENTKGKELLEILQKNTVKKKEYKVIEQIISDYIENLSIGIINLINIFEPEIIGIGGSFVYFEEIFLPRLKEKIKQANKGIVGRGNIELKTATLGNDAGIIGAVL